VPKIFIDTNVYLDFYRAQKDTFKNLEELLSTYAAMLVFPEQVFLEFKRNREMRLSETIKNFKGLEIKLPPSSIASQLPNYTRLQRATRLFNKRLSLLCKDLEDRLNDKTKDEVYTYVVNLYNQATKIPTSSQYIDQAQVRRLLGNPPRPQSGYSHSIGDEIIWEALLDGVNDDLIIVSRDGTYRDHFNFLKEEYLEKTGKCLLERSETISGAVRLLQRYLAEPIKIKNLEEIERLEEKQVEEIKSLELTKTIIWNEYPPTQRCEECGRLGPTIRGLCLRCNAIAAEDC
jgi:predicted nucleic acid-binding protein